MRVANYQTEPFPVALCKSTFPLWQLKVITLLDNRQVQEGLVLMRKSNTLATWYKEPIHWKRPWCWERPRAKEERGGRDGYIASPTQWTWIWANCTAGAEKAMAPHSSTLAWKIPWMEEPGGLQSMGSLWVGHDWAFTFTRLSFSLSLSLLTFMHWRRKWQPTAVFLPGESQGWGNLVGYRLWGRTESDMTEAT